MESAEVVKLNFWK